MYPVRIYRLCLILVYFGTTKFINQRGNINNSRLDGLKKYTIKVVITSDIFQQRTSVINVRGEVNGWMYRVHDLCTVMYKIREHYSRDWYPYMVTVINKIMFPLYMLCWYILHYGNESWNTLQVIFGTMYYYQPSSYFLSQNVPAIQKVTFARDYKNAVLTH